MLSIFLGRDTDVDSVLLVDVERLPTRDLGSFVRTLGGLFTILFVIGVTFGFGLSRRALTLLTVTDISPKGPRYCYRERRPFVPDSRCGHTTYGETLSVG